MQNKNHVSFTVYWSTTWPKRSNNEGLFLISDEQKRVELWRQEGRIFDRLE